MSVQFRLVDFHQKTSTLQVVYFNDDLPDGVNFSLTVPTVDGAYLQGEALEAFIRSFIPHDVFARAAEAKANQLTGELAELVADATEVRQAAPQIMEDRQLFVMEGGQRVLFVRPLVQVNAFDVPVEIV